MIGADPKGIRGLGMSDNGEKPGKSSFKDEIIGLIRHGEVNAFIQRLQADAKKAHRTKIIINSLVIFLGFSIGIGAFYLAYQASANQTLVAIQRAYDQEKSLNIQADIRRKIEWLKKIDAAIINLRKLRYRIILQCKYNKPISAYQQALLRENARWVVANTLSGSKFVFNDALEQKVSELNAFDESVKNLCGKNAPKDIKWREYLIAIDNIMGQTIRKDQDRLYNLNK